MSEREEFDKWFETTSGWTGDEEELAWIAWQAARAAAPDTLTVGLAFSPEKGIHAAPAEPKGEPVAMYWGDKDGEPCINWLNGFDPKGQKVTLYLRPGLTPEQVEEAMRLAYECEEARANCDRLPSAKDPQWIRVREARAALRAYLESL